MDLARYQRIVIAALVIAYIAVRFWGLTATCLWFDEIFSVHAAEHSWKTLLPFVAQDLIHPPLFYLVLKVWTNMGGESLLWLRCLPVAFSIVAVIPFLLLCRELNLQFLSISIAFTFFACSGALIKYAQEVRMYSLLLCLSLFSIWMFLRFFRRGKNIWILTAVNILLVYTHYFGWFVLVGEVLATLIFQRIKIRQVATMFGIAVVSFLPWAWAVGTASANGAALSENLGWIAKPGLGDVFGIVFTVIEPFYYQQSSIDPETHLYITLPLLLIVVVAAGLFYFDRSRNQKKPELGLLAMFFGIPIVLALFASWIFPVSIWGSRHLIIVFAPAFLMFGVMISEIEPRIARLLTIGVLGLFFLLAFVDRFQSVQPKYVWCAWEELAPAIVGGSPQKLYVFEDLVAYHFWFATRGRNDLEIVKVNNVPEMIEDKAYFPPRGFDGVKVVNADEMVGDQFWIAFRDMKWDKRHPPLNILIDRGYKIGNPQIIEADGMKAFLVFAKK